jgi:transcription elongation factor GreA
MTNNKNFVTRHGLKKLQDELHHLISVEAKNSLQMVTDALSNGSKDENDEYLAAKENYQNISNKIAILQDKIKNSEIITIDSKSDIVNMLATVTVFNTKTKQDVTWMLVPENEIDIKNGKISFNSPIGAGLMGKKVGEKAEIKVPAGTLSFEIKKIQY